MPLCFQGVYTQGVSPLNSKQGGLKWRLIEKHEEAQLLTLNVNGSKNDRQRSRQPDQDCLAKTYETHKQTRTSQVNTGRRREEGEEGAIGYTHTKKEANKNREGWGTAVEFFLQKQHQR